MPTLTEGSSFGPYRIVDQLGRGGMASVYKAYEPALDRYVALKVLPAESIEDLRFAERFEREARVVAKLEHPNIIPIFSYGIEPLARIPWMAMRLIAGGSLSATLNNGRPQPGRVVAIIKAVAEALQYAHEKGVVHRDVKPQNILLDESGRVYLADFGIARMVEGSPALTQTGMITGTPHYMAPEQATSGTVDHRCDIYALGIVAYEMLVGAIPFAADTPLAVLMKQVSDPVPLPAPGVVPEPMMRAVLTCMGKKPEDRWQSATDFALALEAGLTESRVSSPPLAPTAPPLARTAPANLPPSSAIDTQPATVTSPARWRLGPILATAGLAGLLGLMLLLAGAWMKLRPETVPAAATAGTVSGAAPAETPSIRAVPGNAALVVDLEVSQAVGAVTEVLYVRLDLDGRTVRTLPLTFPPDQQPVRRDSVVIEGLSPGSHRLEVRIDSKQDMSSTGGMDATRELALGEGVNRLPVKATFTGGPGSTIEFVEP